jgi:hypothetical protein
MTKPKVEPHPCMTVPSEMHERMVDERDKKIEELNNVVAVQHSEINRLLNGPDPSDPQPAREGWWIITWKSLGTALLVVILGISLARFCIEIPLRHLIDDPAIPKVTENVTVSPNGKLTPPDDDAKGHFLSDKQLLNMWNIDLDLARERDHWLRNDRRAYRALDCIHTPPSEVEQEACQALDR